MGKLLNIGRKLKYPITITKLLKAPGDAIKRADSLFEYTFTWFQEVGDPFGETWQEKQVTPGDWPSPSDGKILKWKIHEGMVIEKDMPCLDVEESCSHDVQFAGLCVSCGKDMNETSWATDSKDADRARIIMTHDQTLLSVSHDKASRNEEATQRRLLKNRKLSLVVDLDQTIIQACIDPTVGEWQRDTGSPNYEAVKDVRSFQLADDPRSSNPGFWYFIKMRPGLRDFLAHVSELYELHVYTMGTRAYAQNIAKIVDPEQKLFGDRIISRDENGSVTAKTLSRLFPVTTKMVAIIDDRADVWNNDRPNLIKVVPYDFFIGIGDINSSFLPKREEIPKVEAKSQKGKEKDESKLAGEDIPSEHSDTEKQASKAESAAVKLQEESPKEAGEPPPKKLSAVEVLVARGEGDSPVILQIQAEEQEEALKKQLVERPLLQMQQELEKVDEEETASIVGGESNKNGNGTPANSHARHHLLKDDDTELQYLESHLTELHKAFYDEYDSALLSAQGGRVAHLKPGANRKVSMREQAADLQIVPDIGEVMPRLKARTLSGTVIVLSGLVPLGVDVLRSEIAQQCISFGAQIHTRISRQVTHVVVSANRTRTQKVKQASKYPNIKIVNQQWLLDSMSKWQKEDESLYEVNVPRDDDESRSPSHSPRLSDGDSEDSIDGDNDDDTNMDSAQGNGDVTDTEALEPEEATSPIEDMKTFDWSGADAELAEFMASGDEDDDESGNESDTSHSSEASAKSNVSIRGGKHGLESDDEDTDAESHIAKKKRLANARSTGLKTVKTANSAQSDLPTPDNTAEEGENDGDADVDEVDQIPVADDADAKDLDLDEDDLEAEMLAAFENDDLEHELEQRHEEDDQRTETAAGMSGLDDSAVQE